MAHQKKYFYQYTGLDGKGYVVELWQDTEDALAAEEVTGGNVPFVVEMPELDHKFQVVRGKGCAIEIFSDVDMKFYNGLYHVDPQEFMVYQYVDSVLDFVGYLNSEMYREPYDRVKYTISVTGADGFSLMDRFSFLQLGGSNYTGIKSKWEILQIVLDKINLPWNEILISLSTTFSGYSAAASSTILHESYVDCSNFYDEDNEAMTLREVVESILAPYGATIEAESGNIYIKDIHTLAAGGSITYKRFNASTYAYIAGLVESNEKAISTIQYAGTGQSIEISGGVNKQVVVYSPYPLKTILDGSIASIDEFETVPASFSSKDGYSYKTLEGNDYWNETTPATFEMSYYQDQSNANVYLRWPVLATNQKVAELSISRYLNISGATRKTGGGRLGWENGVLISISIDTLLKTKTNPYDSIDPENIITSIVLSFRLSIGGKYYVFDRFSDFLWTTTIGNTEVFLYESNFSDEFVTPDDNFTTTKGIDIVIGNLSGDLIVDGDIGFEIWSDIRAKKAGAADYDTNPSYVDEVWVKNISVNMKDINGNEISDTDIEYIGLLDNRFQNEGETITLTTGTDSLYADRAKILRNDGTDYLSIKEWTRATQTFKIEELLLGSVSSNYRTGFVSLNGMKLRNAFKLRNVLTDTFIAGKKMMVKSASIDYRNNRIECDLVEISQDELIIVK